MRQPFKSYEVTENIYVKKTGYVMIMMNLSYTKIRLNLCHVMIKICEVDNLNLKDPI